MKNYIRGIIVLAMACGMSVVGEEDWTQKPETNTETKDFSIRISLGNVPGVDEVEIDGGGAMSIDDEGGGRLEILAVKRFWGQNNSKIGGTFGGGIFFAGHSGDGVDISAFGGMIQGGVAAKVGNSVVLELGPYLGLGIAENELAGFESGTGVYGLFGVKGGIFVLLGESFELGLEVGYEGFAQDQEFEGPGGTVDTTWSGTGSRVALVAAIKF